MVPLPLQTLAVQGTETLLKEKQDQRDSGGKTWVLVAKCDATVHFRPGSYSFVILKGSTPNPLGSYLNVFESSVPPGLAVFL